MNRHIRLLTIFALTFLISTIESFADTYGSYGNLVYRVDSAGNTIWVKNFNGNLIPSPVGGNLVYGVSFDGSYVYVLNLQIGNSSSSYPDYYISTVVLDTNGTSISSQTRIETPPNGYTLGTILPSFTSGAWFTQRYGPGFTHISTITKVDSLGRDVAVVSAWFTSATEIKSFIALHDSTFLVAANGYYSSGPTTQNSALIKFDDYGNILWAYCYISPIANALEFHSSVSDENGNIYAIGKYWVSMSNYFTFGLKVDSNGTPIIFRTWNSLNGSYYHELSYRGGEIIDLYQGQEIHFDSLFQDTCLVSSIDSVSFNLTLPYPLSFGGSYPSIFTPSDTTLSLPTVAQHPDYCTQLLVTDEIEVDKILIFPNPTHEKIQIFSDYILNHPEEIKIYDATGREVYSNLNTFIESIDVSQFSNGLYYLKIKSGDVVQSGKFVKQ